MADNPIVVRFEIKQPKVKEELEGIISSMEGFQLDNSSSAISCDLLILEIGEDLKKEFQLAHNIQDSGMAREIFFTSSRLDPELLLQALRVGAKEFFPQPIKKEEVKAALLHLKERREKGNFEGRKENMGRSLMSLAAREAWEIRR